MAICLSKYWNQPAPCALVALAIGYST